MRVLFVTTSFPSDKDDPRGNHIRVLASQLAAGGNQVTVIAPARRGHPLRGQLDGVTVKRFSYWPGGGNLTRNVAGIVPALREKPLRLAQLPPLVASMLHATNREAGDTDMIHAHWLYPAGVVAVKAARKSGKPVVITAHGGDAELASRHRALRRAAVWAIHNSEKTMAVSDAIAASLVAMGGREDKIIVSPLGVPIPTGAADRSHRPPQLLFVGSLIERKGIDILLDAADGIEEGLLELVVVGDGPLQDLVERRAKTNATIRPLGAMSPSGVAQLMQAASALVLPSRSEGRPFVIMEAMAAGLPVLATDIPGSRELVRDGATGLLCELDADSLRQAMVRLAGDSELRDRLGNAGREMLIVEKLTAAHAADRVSAVYESAYA